MAIYKGVYVALNDKGRITEEFSWPHLLWQTFCYLYPVVWYCPGQPSSILVLYSVCNLMIIMPKCLALITVYIMVPQPTSFRWDLAHVCLLDISAWCPPDVLKLPSLNPSSHFPLPHPLILSMLVSVICTTVLLEVKLELLDPLEGAPSHLPPL